LNAFFRFAGDFAGKRRGIRMAPDTQVPDDPDQRRLAELEERLQKARGRGDIPQREAVPSKLGMAFRLVTELVAAVAVGGGIGWGLDRLLGTSPILMIVMLLFGIAAGFVNVVRTARRMDAEGGRER
jgi:ATP synthase protein I